MMLTTPLGLRHMVRAAPFLLVLSLVSGTVFASGLLDLADIIANPDQYDRQQVVVFGQVTNVQLATNRQGQPAYGFLLKDQAGTIKVIGLGQAAKSGYRRGDLQFQRLVTMPGAPNHEHSRSGCRIPSR